MAKIPLIIYTQPPRQYGDKIFYQKIPSELSRKNSVIETILQTLVKQKLIQEQDEIWVRLCLDEVIVNAIRHGNKENPAKMVDIALYADKQNWAVRVEDEGEGFSQDDMLNFDSPDYWESEHGRGILIMRNYMDEIWYYNHGSKVQLAKLRRNLWQKIWYKMLTWFRGLA